MNRGDLITRFDAFYHNPYFCLLEKQLSEVQHPVISLRKISDSFTNGDHGGVKYVDKGVRYLRGQSVTEEGLNLKDELYISTNDHERMIRAEVITGDVLLTIAGSIGNCCVVEGVEKANINQAIVKIRPSTSTIDPNFLSFFLNSKYGKFQTSRLANGAVQLNVNFSEAGDINIIVPSLPEQYRLVAAMDKARSQRKQKLAEADALLSSLDQFILDTLNFRLPPPDNRKVYATTLSQMIGDRIDPYSNKPYFQKLFNAINNSQHDILTLSNLSIRIFSGTTPLAKGDAYVDPPDGVRFIRSGEITTEGTVTPTSEVHISDEIHIGKMKSSQLQKGDLLIAIVGATIGSVGIYNLDEPANINQAIASVRLTRTKVLGEYICWYLRSSIGQRLLDYFKRPVARANINLAEVGEIPIIIPDLQIQETIIKEVYNRRSEAQRLRSEAETGWQAAKQWFEDQLLGGS